MTSPLPVVAGTLQTDPRSGGLKRSSGVNVLPSVAEAWAQVRDDSNKSVDWIIVGYDGTSKTDITVIAKGSGGVNACSQTLPRGRAVFGGCRLENGRFVTFFFADEETPTMQKGRASMHKNGVLNVLEGSDGEIDIKRDALIEKMGDSASGSQPTSTTTAAAEEAPASSPVESTIESEPIEAQVNTAGVVTVSYEMLKSVSDAANLPKGVDPLNREQALSDEEFVEVFGMDKASFANLAGWKRTNLKKARGLF